mmetsp:Transcript_111416/g.325931  ORF Transcript_111416/g.325931 Transcript_111416/m.325931 type:complete len:194 (+) Transcript_111416:59-640(+)
MATDESDSQPDHFPGLKALEACKEAVMALRRPSGVSPPPPPLIVVERPPGEASGQECSAGALQAQDANTIKPMIGAEEDWQRPVFDDFEELYQLTNPTEYLRWKKKVEATANVWQVYVLFKSKWKGPMGNQVQVPHNILKSIALFFDPELYTSASSTPPESCSLGTIRSLLTGTLPPSPRGHVSRGALAALVC